MGIAWMESAVVSSSQKRNSTNCSYWIKQLFMILILIWSVRYIECYLRFYGMNYLQFYVLNNVFMDQESMKKQSTEMTAVVVELEVKPKQMSIRNRTKTWYSDSDDKSVEDSNKSLEIANSVDLMRDSKVLRIGIERRYAYTYGEALEEKENAKTFTASQKVTVRHGEERFSSEEVWRKEKWRQPNCVSQEMVGSFLLYVLWFVLEKTYSETVYQIVSFKKGILSRVYKVILRKEYNQDRINRMLFYWEQFGIYGEGNRNELNASKVYSLGYQTMNTSTDEGEQHKCVWWSQSASHYKVSKYGLYYSW